MPWHAAIVYIEMRANFSYIAENPTRAQTGLGVLPIYCYSYAMYVLLRRDPSRSENLAQDRPNEPATSVFLGFQSIIGAYEQKVVYYIGIMK